MNRHRARLVTSAAAFAAQALCALLVAVPTADAQIPRYGLSTRVENHMLPAVTTGPLDPDWHPDGSSLAYAMRGDIWIQRVDSDHARAVTEGPGYHFEPAWSPDGGWLAFAVDTDGEMDIGVVRSDGTEYRRLTGEGGVDVQPAWTPDGRFIVFASAQGRSFDVLRYELATGEVEPVVEGGSHQFQPAVSPDGSTLAYISRVPGRLGSGGIWTIPLEGGEPTLVHYEETSYRPAPDWTPDGSALLFASDAAGSYDLAAVPSSGGNRVRLTTEALDEFAPAVSPDGEHVAFVANHEGATALWVTSRWGGGDRAWRRVTPERLTPRYEAAGVRGRVVGPDGETVPARIRLLASDGRGYAPAGAFHRVSPANEIHYFHTLGDFEVTVPAGEVRVEALRGFEWIPADVTVDAVPGGLTPVQLRLERLADPAANGWVSGDTHVHDRHEGRWGITQQEFFDWQRADDLHVANDLIHMDGTKIMGRWTDLTGDVWEGSTDEYILRYTQEFRGSFGHVGLLGVSEFIMPLIGGASNTPYPADGLKLMYLDSIRALGGIGGFMHPYTTNQGPPGTVESAAQSDIPIHALLGRGDFYDVVSIASDELMSAEMYYHMLNVGVRLPATGGTDNFSDVWRDPSGGTARTYARIDGALTWRSWIEAVQAGRTVATNGPLLFATVDGLEPGAQLSTRSEATVEIDLASIAPAEVVEVVVDGAVVREFTVEDGGRRLRTSTTVPVDGARWIAVRARGGAARYSGDSYVFAHTTPVYFAGAPANEASRASAAFLARVIEEIWRRVDRRDAWVEPEDRAIYRAQLDEALRRLGVG